MTVEMAKAAYLLRFVWYMRVGLDQPRQTAVCQAAYDRHQRVEIIQLSQPLHSPTHAYIHTSRLQRTTRCRVNQCTDIGEM